MAEQKYKTFTITPVRSSQHALRVTFSSPPINLIGVDLLNDLHAFLISLQKAEDAPKVVVFSSADEKIWLSHLDLHLISAQYPAPPEVDSQAALHRLGETIQLLNSIPVIFIAEVNGLAVGGGNEFAVNMDMRFAGPDARLGIPEVAGGVVHGGGLHRLAQLIGPARALEWNISAKAIDSKEASRIGWVNSAFESGELLREYVDEFAERVSRFPRGGIEATKKGIQETLAGTGSMENDMKRLVQLAHTQEAQGAISGLIELGDDQTRGSFELELPDASSRYWE
ncbi:ClpP/crotonase [Lophium mytilinum]|uniref:ClpP/crotonase n=1 Tax=Lophium mytilinum TaxID=390894 RepID=A0A6A6QVA5_9PEZI|nr:ClpP/crotonase [Lophium mytilinum]